MHLALLPFCERCILYFTCLKKNSYAEQENSDISSRKRWEVGGRATCHLPREKLLKATWVGRSERWKSKWRMCHAERPLNPTVSVVQTCPIVYTHTHKHNTDTRWRGPCLTACICHNQMVSDDHVRVCGCVLDVCRLLRVKKGHVYKQACRLTPDAFRCKFGPALRLNREHAHCFTYQSCAVLHTNVITSEHTQDRPLNHDIPHPVIALQIFYKERFEMLWLVWFHLLGVKTTSV